MFILFYVPVSGFSFILKENRKSEISTNTILFIYLDKICTYKFRVQVENFYLITCLRLSVLYFPNLFDSFIYKILTRAQKLFLCHSLFLVLNESWEISLLACWKIVIRSISMSIYRNIIVWKLRLGQTILIAVVFKYWLVI